MTPSAIATAVGSLLGTHASDKFLYEPALRRSLLDDAALRMEELHGPQEAIEWLRMATNMLEFLSGLDLDDLA